MATLKALAEALDCAIGDLFETDPTAGDGMWSLWADATNNQRSQIIEHARIIVRRK